MTQAAKQLVKSSLRRAEKNIDVIVEGTYTGQDSKIAKHLPSYCKIGAKHLLLTFRLYLKSPVS